MKITITNGKGGTGKTTLNIFLALWLFTHGNKVLLIDLDPNCSLSEVMGKVLQEQNSKILLTGREVTPYSLKKSENGAVLDIIPSDLDLDMLANITDMQLKMQLKKQGFTDRYDYILIDPPGTWNAQTRNAVFASESVIVVGKCSPLDFAATQNYIQKLQDCCIDSDVTVVCNSYNAASDPDNIWQKYQETFGDFLLKEPVPKMNSLKRLMNNPEYHIRADLEERLLPFVKAVTLGKCEEKPNE